MCEVVLRNQPIEVERLAAFVEQFGADHQLSDKDVLEINLVLDEIVLNVINHGHDDGGEHLIHVRLAAGPDAVTIAVEDDGKAFNPLEAPPPDLTLSIEERPIGGLGIFLMKSLTSAMDYRREDDRNKLTLTKPRRA